MLVGVHHPAGPDLDAEPDFEALRLHLAQLRHDRGWSFDELAARSGVGRATLTAIEDGKPRRNPQAAASRGSLRTWFRLAVAFEIDLGDLLRPLYGPGGRPTDRQ